WSLGHDQVRDNPSELLPAIEAPINRISFTLYSGKCRLPAELALLPDNRQCSKLFQVQCGHSGGRSAVFAKVSGLLLSAVHHGGEMDRCLILMALGTKRHTRSQLTV